MRTSTVTREEALSLFKQYNTEDFHIRHAITVEAIMRYFAEEYAPEEVDYWGIVGLLHDIDFELYPEEHCVKAEVLLQEGGVGEDMITAVISHGYGICSTVEPTHQMEKILFAMDELSGLIGAAALVRPSKSTKDMNYSSLRKKFKDKSFAAGCSRDTIERGAELLDWSLEELLKQGLAAMQASEDAIEEEVSKQTA